MSSCIYLASIKGLNSIYKIGMTGQIDTRISGLSSLYKREVAVVFVLECAASVTHSAERMIHHDLSEFRYKGKKIKGRELYTCTAEQAETAIIDAVSWAERYPGIKLLVPVNYSRARIKL